MVIASIHSKVSISRWLLYFIVLPLILCAHSEEALSRADQILQQDPQIGLSHEQLVDLFSFIENIPTMKKKLSVFTRKQTHLPCVIERCPTLQGFLIKDLSEKISRIGHGAHKVIRKAILCGRETKVIAFCDCDKTGKAEASILKNLCGQKGIVSYLGMDPRGKDRYSIYLDYYPDRSLRKNIVQGIKFTPEQTMHIAKCVIEGLQSMHSKRLIHRDLHEGNILLKKQDNGDLYDAVLVDFGKTLSLKASQTVLPQIPHTKSPPEVLAVPLKRINRYQSEVYALGCVFYGMVWGKHPSWSTLYNNRHLSEIPSQKRKSCFKKTAFLFKKARRTKLGNLLEKRDEELTKFERFQHTIFTMLDYTPEKRPSLEQLLEQLSL